CGDMIKGLLKMCMLKIISMKNVSGYQIIKRVEVLTGEKPSTGSVYPLLKSMQNEGWVIGKKAGNKTLYEITDKGKEIIQKHDELKEQISQKVRESILLAHNTFEDFTVALSKDFHVAFVENLDILSPLISEISRLQATGMDTDKIKEVVSKARDELQKLT
ncbi:MAG: PadR family transcriptional regulator, partial [Candidatus Bathyarchaeota archaeon]|nr:PadR family transcriptional regulator [Candidatus Bathyarchaeota archaeon]